MAVPLSLFINGFGRTFRLWRAIAMLNPHAKELENTQVRVRCPECRKTFHERLNRVIHGDRVTCRSCGEEMHFHGIGAIHEHDSVADYIHHVEEHTCHPHFSLGR
jgi:hydrogenase maturation factor HypF (carbamoyltransferase family)